jgi:hypothetical protein
MNEKFYVVVPIKVAPKNGLPTGCKATFAEAIEYATKQLSDTTVAKCAICEVSEIVERASPPISRRPPVETTTDNTGREWSVKNDQSETSTTDRDYSHG